MQQGSGKKRRQPQIPVRAWHMLCKLFATTENPDGKNKLQTYEHHINKRQGLLANVDSLHRGAKAIAKPVAHLEVTPQLWRCLRRLVQIVSRAWKICIVHFRQIKDPWASLSREKEKKETGPIRSTKACRCPFSSLETSPKREPPKTTPLPHRLSRPSRPAPRNARTTGASPGAPARARAAGCRPSGNRGERAQRISRNGYGSKLSHQGTAGLGPWFYLPGFHFGYLFLTLETT